MWGTRGPPAHGGSPSPPLLPLACSRPQPSDPPWPFGPRAWSLSSPGFGSLSFTIVPTWGPGFPRPQQNSGEPGAGPTPPRAPSLVRFPACFVPPENTGAPDVTCGWTCAHQHLSGSPKACPHLSMIRGRQKRKPPIASTDGRTKETWSIRTMNRYSALKREWHLTLATAGTKPEHATLGERRRPRGPHSTSPWQVRNRHVRPRREGRGAVVSAWGSRAPATADGDGASAFGG